MQIQTNKQILLHVSQVGAATSGQSTSGVYFEADQYNTWPNFLYSDSVIPGLITIHHVVE